MFIKGRETPEYQSVSFDEYVGRKKDGTINGQWSKKPATMIRKVAVVQALREAFPDKFQGLYAQEEFPDVSDVKLDVEKLWQKRYRQMQTLSSFLTQHLRKYRRPQRRTLPAQRHRIALSRRTP